MSTYLIGTHCLKWYNFERRNTLMQNETIFGIIIFTVFCNGLSSQASYPISAFIDFIIAKEKLNRMLIGILATTFLWLVINFIYKLAIFLNSIPA